MTDPGDLLFEIVPREDTRSVVKGRPTWPWRSVVLLLPAGLLVAMVLIVPLAATVLTSLRAPGSSGWLGFGNFAAIRSDGQVMHALRNSLLWLLIALLVCVIGFGLAQLGHNSRRLRAFVIGGIAAPMAASAVVAGVAFRLMYDPQPDRGTVTALTSAAQDLFGHRPLLPDARPDPDGVLVEDAATGDLITAVPPTRDQAVELKLTGTPPPADRSPARMPDAGAGKIVGVVTVRGVAVPDVPVSVTQFGYSHTTRTSRDGAFQFDLSSQAGTADAQFTLRIPASVVAPASDAVAFLGPGWIWWVLGSAFAWGWMGLAVVVFRSGLRAVPHDLLRMARAYGAGRLRRAHRVLLPSLIPVIGVVTLTVLVAAARVFDLVLVGAPGSVQSDVDVVGVHWWRSRDALGPGGAAALATLLFAAVAVFALLALLALNRPWPANPAQPEPDLPRSRTRRWVVRGLGTFAMVLWLLPLLLLLLTSLRSRRDSAVAGWWASGRDRRFGLDSYRAVFAGGEMGHAWVATAIRATVATGVLLFLAVLAAYPLACGALSRGRAGRTMLGITAVLAVVPVQAVAEPLSGALDRLGLAGAPYPLILIHAAFGVPFAVLLLRPAFRAVTQREPPRTDGDERMSSLMSHLRVVVSQSWKTVLAVAVMEWVFVWNDLVVGLLLGPANTSVTLALFEQTRQFATSAGVVAAGAIVSLAAPLVLVLVTGKWVVQGLTAGMTR